MPKPMLLNWLIAQIEARATQTLRTKKLIAPEDSVEITINTGWEDRTRIYILRMYVYHVVKGHYGDQPYWTGTNPELNPLLQEAFLMSVTMGPTPDHEPH